MEAFKKFVNNHFWKVMTALFAVLFLSKGCVNNRVIKLDKKYDEVTQIHSHGLDSLNAAVINFATKEEVKDAMKQVMFEYLIYEDDLDKGKISLSDIKNKIESNEQ